MKNYLIIGASSGIGQALAHQLMKTGNQVYATYFKQEKQSQTNLHYFRYNAVEDTIDLSQLPDTLDGLVYCPGSINLKPFHRFNESDFVEDFRLQVTGAIRVIQQVLHLLKQSTEPSSILLFSTVAVQQGLNFHAQVSTSKGAIEGLTRALAAELAPKIRVNAIAPSLTDTPLASRLLNSDEKKSKHAQNNPLHSIGKAENLAEVASFLLSSQSKWITGQIHHVDGGFSTIKH